MTSKVFRFLAACAPELPKGLGEQAVLSRGKPKTRLRGLSQVTALHGMGGDTAQGG